ncbi:MAG: hypothetical protein PHS98_04165 [Bacilli bacterium]|nr:hypothetical protein [Bacilli bacterium]
MKSNCFRCRHCGCYCPKRDNICPPDMEGIKSFGYIYTLADSETDTIAGGSAIEFSTNGPLYNISHAIGAESITIKNSGSYLINYSINAQGNPNAIVALAVNNIVNTSTRIKLLTANTHVFGTAILNLTANDTLTLVNDSDFNLTIDRSPIVGAQITIAQLS